MVNRAERDVLDRLGKAGLLRVLDDLLDQGRLVRLANVVGVKYPGLRVQSQKRERVLADLASRALDNDRSGRSLIRALRKQTADSARAWSALAPDERKSRLQSEAAARDNGGLGLHLFLVASAAPDPDTEPLLEALLATTQRSSPEPVPASVATGRADRDNARLRKKTAELQKKLRHLESQIAKSRETEKTLKRDLIQRKGELAEARMLAERLRREIEESRGSTAAAVPKAPEAAQGSLAEIERTLKRIVSEQRKIAHRVEKLDEAPPSQPSSTEISRDDLVPVAQAIQALEKEVAALRRERKKDLTEQAKRIDDLHAAVRSANDAGTAGPRPSRSGARRRGEPERVGVFIDVQNVYYAARQLKGKLDFDALLQAAVLDRRLIHATAYVVESKEIDQSGFIAMLQQRAIEVRRKTLQVRADGSMKGDWDMEMALDILDATPQLDVVVLVSGDGDFTSLVKRVKAMGPRVEVVAFPRNTAKSLVGAADRFLPLDRKYMIRSDAGAEATDRSPTGTPASEENAAVSSARS